MINRRFVALFGLTLIFVCTLSFSKPLALQGRSVNVSEPTVQIQFRYYPIEGRTASELRSQMAAYGPPDQLEGRRYDANVVWAINWSFRHATSQGQCKLQSAKTHVKVTYTLPKWKTPINVERSLIADWNQYLAALQAHEDGHKNHGIGAARGILQALNQLPPSPTCEALEAKAQATARAVIKAHNQKDLDYDRVTQHGYTQGAVFPTFSTVSR